MTGEIKIKSQEGLSNKECAEEIGQFLSAVSNEYEPIDLTKLPSYLPSLPPPQMQEYQIYQKLKGLNNTKSTLPIDIPAKLRKEVAVELTKPLTNIINSCLDQGVWCLPSHVEKRMGLTHTKSERARSIKKCAKSSIYQ